MKFETLERRALLSVSFNAQTGLLTVNGTSTNDVVLISQTPTELDVLDAGVNHPFVQPPAKLKSIKVTLGAGTDSATIANSVVAPATITAGPGNDTLVAGGGLTTLTGGSGNDYLQAGAASDSLVGGSANNTLVAGSGNDMLVGHGQGNDYIFATEVGAINYVIDQAAGGVNVLDFSALTSSDPLTVNLQHDLMASYDNVTIHDAKSGQFRNFDVVIDGQGNDFIAANNYGDSIVGGNGNDTIYGGLGADTISLGSGSDTVSGEGGADVIQGTTGNYVIYATDASSDPAQNCAPGNLLFQLLWLFDQPGITVDGGSGTASIVGSAGNDTLSGEGSVTIHGMGGDDVINGGSGPSLLFGDAGNDSITAGSGDTTIVGGTGQDTVNGGSAGNDFIDKNIPDNCTTATNGIDPVALTANAIAAAQGLVPPTYPYLGADPSGRPFLFGWNFLLGCQNNGGGGSGGDVITGGGANTTVIGGAGSDIIRGGAGPDTLIAGPGNTLLVGGVGSDVLQGGAGVDSIAGGDGPDLMQGGTGDTTFFNNNGFPDTVIGGSGFNQAEVDQTYQSSFSNIQLTYDPYGFEIYEDEALTASAAVAQPAVTPSIVTLPAPTFSGGVLTVGSQTVAQDQTITISEDSEFVHVMEANSVAPDYDYIATGVTKIVVYGGPDDDSVNLNTLLVPTTVNLGNGNNYFVGGTSNETVTSGTGNDTLIGGPGANVISGGSGDNLIYGGTGNDSITGGSGVDRIYGGGYGYTAYGDPESDTIKGGTGTEFLYMSGDGDPLTARLDKGTILDNTTGVTTYVTGVKNFFAGPGNSTIVAGTAQVFCVNGGAGNDTIYGSSTGDFLYGGLGSNYIYADGTQQTIDTYAEGPGSTSYYAKGAASNLLDINTRDVSVALLKPPP